MESSPLLHRQDEIRKHAHEYRVGAERLRAEQDRQTSKLTLEKLRYRWWVRRGTLGSFMQGLGEFGRKHFGFLDPRQSGGGWW